MDGATLREHLQGQYERTGVMPDRLRAACEVPEGCSALWGDFLYLHRERADGAITSQQLLFWQVHEGHKLASWEIAAIRAADAEYLNWRGRQSK